VNNLQVADKKESYEGGGSEGTRIGGSLCRGVKSTSLRYFCGREKQESYKVQKRGERRTAGQCQYDGQEGRILLSLKVDRTKVSRAP